MTPGNNRLNRFPLSLEYRLNRAVITISYPSRNSPSPCFLLRVGSKEHALYNSNYDGMSADVVHVLLDTSS